MHIYPLLSCKQNGSKGYILHIKCRKIWIEEVLEPDIGLKNVRQLQNLKALVNIETLSILFFHNCNNTVFTKENMTNNNAEENWKIGLGLSSPRLLNQMLKFLYFCISFSNGKQEISCKLVLLKPFIFSEFLISSEILFRISIPLYEIDFFPNSGLL